MLQLSLVRIEMRNCWMDCHSALFCSVLLVHGPTRAHPLGLSAPLPPPAISTSAENRLPRAAQSMSGVVLRCYLKR